MYKQSTQQTYNSIEPKTYDMLETLHVMYRLESCAATTSALSMIRTPWCPSYFSFRPRRMLIVSATFGSATYTWIFQRQPNMRMKQQNTPSHKTVSQSITTDVGTHTKTYSEEKYIIRLIMLAKLTAYLAQGHM
jgi:hypothetical protein